ncbi:hypothetical protein FRACYDRAFT_233759 [Fragilariopsis cylindrus CCMP1102]|uniref:Uncharacterized protein n=1 Tax=Fragilariopsis cylindrus CCMP1102 TaxID=635003 RepID=A0A1E7FZP9_9STRA|nr:hypothetical protein FRACYDRAFT_233759 [Fragilariopsis cylindrus CCMP1102]|eukprot:OEU23584.1 hypothetical protein FRACYDRAFT_233759 [Fragilariopsis cylindrus CCMP1102]
MNSSATLTTFGSPLCSRKGPHDSINSEGFFFVDDGMIVVHHELKMIGIFENGVDTIPVLEINLTTATQITFKKIRSSNNTFEGGRVQISGIFDRGYEETVTIKMYTNEYKRLGRLLQSIGV